MSRPPDVRPWVLGGLAGVLAILAIVRDLPRAYERLDEGPKIAAHLARGDGFASPLHDPTLHGADPPPTAFLPPIYPAVMAGAYRVLGIDTRAALNVMLGLNVLAFAAFVGGTYGLLRELLPGPPGRLAGTLAGLGVLAYPAFVLRAGYFWDTFLALAIFAWLAVAAVRLGRSAATDPLRLAAFGGGLGMLALTNVSFTLTYPLLVLTATRGRAIRRQATLVAASLVGFAVVLTPWTVRNAVTFDRLFYVRGGASLEFWLGNRPGTTGWMDVAVHPSVYEPQGRLYRERGELAYFDDVGQRFRQDFADDRSGFLRRTLNRVVYVFVGEPTGGALRLVRTTGVGNLARLALDLAVAVAGIVGVVLAWRGGSRWGVWLLTLGMLAVAPYLVTHVSYRYALPLKWTLLAAAGLGGALVWHSMTLRRTRS